MAVTHQDHVFEDSCEPDMPHLDEGPGGMTGTDGGYFVPPELTTEVNQLIRDGGCVEGFARHFPMRRLELIMRKFATGVDGYWVGPMCVKEKDAPDFELVTLHAEKMAVIVPFEDQLLEDADHDMAALIKTDVVGAFVEAIDRTFLGYELGTPFADSLSGNTPAAHTIPYGTDVDLAGDLSDAVSEVEADGFDVTGMIAHPRVKHLLRNLRDLNNQLIFTENLSACSPRERYCIWGIPICFTRQMAVQSSPAGYEILMAHFPYVFVGDRTGLQVAISNEATLTSGSLDNINLFEQDMTAKLVGPFSREADCKVGYMLETPSIPRYSSTLVDSENATGADNQQGSFTRPSDNPSETTRRPLGYFPYSKVMI